MRKNTIKIICLFLCLSQGSCLIAQPGPKEILLGGQDVERTGSQMKIRYSIKFGERVQSCDIQLFLIADGREYSQPIETGISGDIGTISQSGVKLIVWQMSEGDIRKLAGKPLSFRIAVKNKTIKKNEPIVIQNKSPNIAQEKKQEKLSIDNKSRNRKVIIAASVQMPFSSESPSFRYGAMAGIVNKAGIYVKGVSDYKYPLEKNVESYMNSDIWLGSMSKSFLSAGLLGAITDYIIISVGGGYWQSSQWGKQASDNQWVKVLDHSSKGGAVEFGVLIHFNHFLLSVGSGVILPGSFTVDMGMGVCF